MAQQKLKLMKLQEERLQQEKERSTKVSRREDEDDRYKRVQTVIEITDRIKALRHELKNEEDEDNHKDILDQIALLQDEKTNRFPRGSLLSFGRWTWIVDC